VLLTRCLSAVTELLVSSSVGDQQKKMKVMLVRVFLLLLLMMMMTLMIIPVTSLIMVIMTSLIIPVTSRLTSAKVISYRGFRKTTNGELMCALDTANEIISSSSQQECSLRCIDVKKVDIKI